MKKTILIVIFIIISSFSFADEYKAQLPYEVIGGKMIIEIEVNGVKKKALFDTGAAKNSITKDLMKELGLSATSTMMVKDVNNKESEHEKTVLGSVSIPNSEMGFSGFEAIILDGDPFKCYGVEMLIGSEMFADRLILEIDNQTKLITISYAQVPPKASLRTVRQFVQNGYMPIINVNLDGTQVPTLFDTGFGGLFLFRESDYLANEQKFNTISKTLTEGSHGISGGAGMKISNRVVIKNLNIGIAKFFNAVVETSGSPFSLMGVKLLDYGKVTIDYGRKKFYFEPYKNEISLPLPLNTYSMMVKDGKLVICNVWSDDKNGIANGDIVTHINGKEAPKVDFCQSITTGIAELKAKQKTKVTVETKNGKKEIIYYNKK